MTRSGLIWVCAFVLAALLCAAAQVQVGDNLRLNLSGNLSSNYAGSFANTDGSSHGLGFGGNADLTGSYFSPTFIGFRVSPYYDWSGSSSDFASTSRGSGYASHVDIFSGSHFPGSIDEVRAYNTLGMDGIPGLPGVVTEGQTHSFGIGWCACFPRLPSLSASYSTSSSTNSIIGFDNGADSHTAQRTFTLASGYSWGWRGWHMMAQGRYGHSSGLFTAPSALIGAEGKEEWSGASNNGFNFSAQHAFPLKGQLSINASRSSYHYDANGSDSSADSVYANVNVRPTKKLVVSANSGYTDSVYDQLMPDLLNSGLALSNYGTSRMMYLNANTSYVVLSRITVSTFVSRQEQFLFGGHYGATQFGASANYGYSHPLFGLINFSANMTDTANKEGNSSIGGAAGVNFRRKISHWDLSGDFRYGQNVNTLFVVYTTSSYSYGASASRKLTDSIHWSGSFSGAHSGLTTQDGSSSHTEMFTSSLLWRGYSVSGNYSQSMGASVLTPTGLVSVGTATEPLIPQQLLIYNNATSYGGSVSLSPLRNLGVMVTYSSAEGATSGAFVNTGFRSTLINGRLRYRMRKIQLESGFNSVKQGFSVTGNQPVVVTSYYFGLSRWFKAF